MYFRKKEFLDTMNGIQKQIDSIRLEINAIGTGDIVCRKRNDKLFFSERTNRAEHGITHDQAKIYRLTKKEYLSELLKALENNQKVLNYCHKHYTDVTSDTIFSRLAARCPNLPAQTILTTDQDSWATKPYQKNPYYPEDLQYISTNGVVVRSKSEREIANTLEALGIPYKYDVKVSFGNTVYYADFVIKRPDGALVIWEHLGRTNDPVYCAKNEVRIKDYIKHGYRPWDNLIWTLEEDIQDSRNIRKIVQRFILSDMNVKQ